jgi:hypothetical protein
LALRDHPRKQTKDPNRCQQERQGAEPAEHRGADELHEPRRAYVFI